jgi:hypothetical protein
MSQNLPPVIAAAIRTLQAQNEDTDYFIESKAFPAGHPLSRMTPILESVLCSEAIAKDIQSAREEWSTAAYWLALHSAREQCADHYLARVRLNDALYTPLGLVEEIARSFPPLKPPLSAAGFAQSLMKYSIDVEGPFQTAFRLLENNPEHDDVVADIWIRFVRRLFKPEESGKI